MDFKFIFFISLLCIALTKGEWSLLADKCCVKGKLWFNSNRQACPLFSTSLPDIPKQHYEMCVSVLSMCCLMARKEYNCNAGVEVAKKRQSCSSLDRTNYVEEERECCHCCYMGILLSKFNLPCNMNLKAIDLRCLSKLLLCCGNNQHYQTTKKFKQYRQSSKVHTDFCGNYPEKLCGQICENVPGSYICRCREGYELLSDNKKCRLKELTETVAAVKCKTGFTLKSRNKCEDINECLQDNKCQKNEECINLDGSYTCKAINIGSKYLVHSCGTGFVYNHSRLSCEDINECLKNHKCDKNETCINTQGSYQCHKTLNVSCDVGYFFSDLTNKCEDFNECTTALENCPIGMKCFNTIGSYTCKRARECGTGYKLNAATDECEDIDECVLNIHDCGSSRTCKNIVGSFRCLTTNCLKGHKFSEVIQGCEPIKCPIGMELNGKGECDDLNECLKNPRICPPAQKCENTFGSYKCADAMVCPIGFVLNKTQDGCIDVDECATSVHKCSFKNMLCNNTIGSYVCLCPSGTEVNRITKECKDINECIQKISACSAHTICENTYGSYRCVCRDGFKLEGNECKDANECLRKGTCQHICTNVWGSFRCTCKPGYKLAADNRSCEDLNECTIPALLKGKEACKYNCSNEIGSFNCSCPAGYYTTREFKCEDIDECKHVPPPCHLPNEICINLKGSFRCEDATCNIHYNRIVKGNSIFKLVECDRHMCDRSDSHCLNSPSVIRFFYLSLNTSVPIPYAITQLTMPDVFANSFKSKLIQFKANSREPYATNINENYFQLVKDYSQDKNALIIEMVKKIDDPHDINFKVITEAMDPGPNITLITHIHIYVTKIQF